MAYASNKFGLLLKSPDGLTTILDETGILQTWQESGEDNLDSSHPMELHLYLPSTATVYQALLRLKLKAFRAYETATSSTSDTAKTSTTNGQTLAISEDDEWRLFVTNIPDAMSEMGSHDHGDTYSRDLGSHQHGYWDDPVGANDTDYEDLGSHYHGITHDGDHIHSITAHHTHEVYIGGHEHSVTVPGHSHDINFGIYTSTSATGVTVRINGVDRTASLGGPFSADQANVNVAPYLVADQWNTISLGTTQLGRIHATIFIQALMKHS